MLKIWGPRITDGKYKTLYIRFSEICSNLCDNLFRNFENFGLRRKGRWVSIQYP